jgi:hypothetical protein
MCVKRRELIPLFDERFDSLTDLAALICRDEDRLPFRADIREIEISELDGHS